MSHSTPPTSFQIQPETEDPSRFQERFGDQPFDDAAYPSRSLKQELVPLQASHLRGEQISGAGQSQPSFCLVQDTSQHIANVPFDVPQIFIHPSLPDVENDEETEVVPSRPVSSLSGSIRRLMSPSRNRDKGENRSIKSKASTISTSSKFSTYANKEASQSGAKNREEAPFPERIPMPAPSVVEPSTSNRSDPPRLDVVYPSAGQSSTQPFPQQSTSQLVLPGNESDRGLSTSNIHLSAPSRQPSHRSSHVSIYSAAVASRQAQGEVQDYSRTPISSADKNENLQSQWSSWSTWQSQESAWCDVHKVLANATALYDWSGVIPSRSTRGCPLKAGSAVDICNVVNESWYQIHSKGRCEYVPSMFVRIDGYTDDGARNLFMRYSKPRIPTNTNVAPDIKAIQSPVEPPRKNKQSLWRRMLSSPFDLVEPAQAEKEKKQNERPPIPQPPFDREPHDTEQNQNRVVVSMKCRPFVTGIVITFYISLIPGPQWRFTAFRFAAELPPGQIVVGMYPQKVHGQATDVRHNDTRNQELAITTKVDQMGVGLEFGHTSGKLQEVEYTRKTRVEIIGGGLNCGKATWTATENLADRSGLENRLELSILVPTAAPPTTIKCRYSVELEKAKHVHSGPDQQDSFEKQFDFSFTADRLVSRPHKHRLFNTAQALRWPTWGNRIMGENRSHDNLAPGRANPPAN